MTKWKWELLMIIAALALLLAMPALVAAADQGQGVRNAEMAAADAKAPADMARAAVAGAGCESFNFKFETDLRANKVATPLLTFKTTYALDNLIKAKAGYATLSGGQTPATSSETYACHGANKAPLTCTGPSSG